MAWGLIMDKVQSEKVAVFLPTNVRPPKKKLTSYKKTKQSIKSDCTTIHPPNEHRREFVQCPFICKVYIILLKDLNCIQILIPGGKQLPIHSLE